MKLATFVLLVFAVPLCASSRHLSHPVMVSRDDAFSGPRKTATGPDTVRVLAALVQFQPDDDTRTTGNGQFILTPSADPVIDAPPHDTRYFLDHLTFLSNYYRKASKGKLIVVSTLVDSIFTLPAGMGSYSPPKNGPDSLIANLAQDAWRKVDSSGRVPDFSQYQCFIVFHAGAGHDIDLVSSLGYDPTPLDIPSLFIGLNAFRKFYGADYRGIPVNGGAFHITNSCVLPETESRLLPGPTGDVPLTLGINGLVCATVGSFLGLPDLFDTNTGASGIGRFGLMDGQAIFSFSGAFPPEPSAWEKYWLGWIAPITVPPGTTTLSLPAVALADTVYRVPISSQEYFLVENRNRDPLRNGQRITSSFNGTIRQQTFLHDTTGFRFDDVTALSGVITDVEDLDWSLPGDFASDGTFFDGGILIWHVDEGVIAARISSNGVNADPAHRGVDVEEADGSQDIGQSYGLLSAGSGSEEGTPLDFWFQGNSSPVYKNAFSATTLPNTNSNAGARSHVTVKDFTARGPRMSLTVVRGDGEVVPLAGFPRQTGRTLTDICLAVGNINATPEPEILVTTKGIPAVSNGTIDAASQRGGESSVFAWSLDGSPVATGLPANGLFAVSGDTGLVFSGPAAIADAGGGSGIGVYMTSSRTSLTGRGNMHAFVAQVSPGDTLARTLRVTPVADALPSPAVVSDSLAATGGSRGKTYFLKLGGAIADSITTAPDTTITGTGVAMLGDNLFCITSTDGAVTITRRSGSGAAAGLARTFQSGKRLAGPASASTFVNAAGVTYLGLVFVSADGQVFQIDTTSMQITPGFPVDAGGPITVPAAIADVNGDGRRDIVVFSGSSILVYNAGGAQVDNFPITIPTSSPLASPPIVADVDGDGKVEVVGVSADGLVVAYNGNGQMARGFPLQAGRGRQTAAVFLKSDSICLAVASSDDGSVSAWETGKVFAPGSLALYPWPQYQHDARHQGLDVTPLSGNPVSADFFPKDRAYNWPNPVYDGKTHIRYFVRDNATVRISVYDLAGDLVTEFPGPGVGGLDNEVVWNVANIQSGIYFARIEASGAGGSGVAIVKVAVVK